MITLQSTNPTLSYIIHKNPNNNTFGVTGKSQKNGSSIGFFQGDQTYHCLFLDNPKELSYSKELFEYLDTTKYTHPNIYLDLIKNFFDTVLKKDSEYDKDEYTHTITIHHINLASSKYISLFDRYFQSIEFEKEITYGNNSKITLKHTGKLRYLLSVLVVYLVLVLLTTNDDIYYDDSLINKYINIMKYIKVPYFIAYVFKSRLINSKTLFESVKKELNMVCNEDVNFTIGDTHVQRMGFIEKYIHHDYGIIDVGCGEGRYVKRFAKRVPLYYAYDIDKDVLEKLENKVEKYWKLENVEVVDTLKDIPKNKYYTIILTEVIEHMSLNEAKKLIKKLLKEFKIKTFIITTPNKDFNEFYNFKEGDTRHNDHVFEMTSEEFKKFIGNFDLKDFDVKISQIGDVVNGIQTTQCVVLEETKKKKELKDELFMESEKVNKILYG